MQCRSLISNDGETQKTSSGTDPCYNSADLDGYVTETGTIFFCEIEPKFCPETGQWLEMVEYLPGESMHDFETE